MRTQTERRVATRAEILRAATKIMMEQGYNACSISTIAKGTSFTTGAIQYHFKSKNELLHAVVTEHVFTMPSSTGNTITPDQSIEKRCRKIVDAMWAYYGHENYSIVWEIMLGCRNNKALLKEISRFFQKARSEAENKVQDVFTDLHLTADQAKEITLFIGAYLRGISLLRFTDSGNQPVSHQPQYVAQLLSLKLHQYAQENGR